MENFHNLQNTKTNYGDNDLTQAWGAFFNLRAVTAIVKLVAGQS